MQDFWCDDIMGSARDLAKCEQGLLLALLKRDEGHQVRETGQEIQVICFLLEQL